MGNKGIPFILIRAGINISVSYMNHDKIKVPLHVLRDFITLKHFFVSIEASKKAIQEAFRSKYMKPARSFGSTALNFHSI